MTPSKKTKTAAADKDKKSKLVRDSFTIPKNEYAAIDALKARALTLGVAIKKSELLRAGLMQLNALGEAELKAALAAVPTLKTGRPSSSQPEATEPVVEVTAAVAQEVIPEIPVAAAPVAAARKSRKSKAAPAAIAAQETAATE